MDDEILLKRLLYLRDQAVTNATQFRDAGFVHPARQVSAYNLLHYLALRSHELRDLQLALIERGLTSLGILEAHTLATLNSVIAVLQRLAGQPVDEAPTEPVSVASSAKRLELNTLALFGQRPPRRDVHIMVTMPSEAADSPVLIENLLTAGMDVMRINCAHDTADEWQQMIANLRMAETRSGKTCKVQLDLAGPKLRTGAIGAAGRVLKIKPTRDLFGHVHMPGRFWLVPEGEGSVEHDDPTLEVRGKALADTRTGDYFQLNDARDAARELRIVAEHQYARLAESDQTVYLQENTVLLFERNGSKVGKGTVVNVSEVIQPLVLQNGDRLVLTRADEPGKPAERDADGREVRPARIHCTLPEAFTAVLPGQQVWLDDGKVGGNVESCDGDEICLRITHTPPHGAKLRAEKGINFPDTEFHTPALTDKDIADLEAMAGKVDMVALSFVRSPQDVETLQFHLQRLGIPDTGIILKIENRAAFEKLPAILLTALRSPRVGVMIARGDLAVEVGFERLSEVQEEILWLCEAAHIPVIWATQILESMAKKGAPSRAEVTDAAMSIRAECAMLNKGPNIVDTVRFLDGILQRMESHYHKRRLMMRPLQVCSQGKL
ncbi:pyruvate kinase [Thiothrix nivea]|uniref:pyruvate kinase n=1 Tax=Thiothrix nivea (strain ATCC 35100 / DSM 5205 / JP2) TaxID=870187 RepID=A0A656HA21_THINJ|nr:pyruvate kinase [Thiothrix nivea]EIJ33528.1 Pyruvate kinase barrel [Thiothrix nivea DSM 5205]